MKDKFMNGLLTVAGKMQSNSVLSAIKDAFIDNMDRSFSHQVTRFLHITQQ